MRVSVERIGIIAGLRRRENASLSQCKLGGSNKDFPKRFIESHDQAMPVVRYVDNDDNASEEAHMTKLAPLERAKLRQFLSDRFSQGELKALAFDLGADYEVMKHSDKEELSVELVSYLQRRDQLRCLVEEALKRRPGVDIDMTDLLAKLPPCLPSRKVQIILADDMPIEITTLKEELSILFGVNREKVAFIGIARGSTRLLISLPGRAGDPRDSGEARGIGEGKYRIVSTDPFESLPLVSQEAWRMIIWKRPPTCQDGVFRSGASWKQALTAAKKVQRYLPAWLLYPA